MILRTRNLLAGTVAISILSTSATLWAQTAVTEPARAPAASTASDLLEAFDKADVKKVGELTKEQAQSVPGLAPSFDAVDTNHDKLVSREELKKALQ